MATKPGGFSVSFPHLPRLLLLEGRRRTGRRIARADANGDGTLSWPEYKDYKKKLDAGEVGKPKANPKAPAAVGRLQTGGTFSNTAEGGIIFTDQSRRGVCYVIKELAGSIEPHLDKPVKIVANVKDSTKGEAKVMVHLVSIQAIRYEAFLKSDGPGRDIDFLRLIARELYTDTAAIFAELDPQRLIFGERYNTFNVPREVLEEAAKVVDVLSVQPYDAKFNAAKFDEWHALNGKPMVISDWNLSFPTPAHKVTIGPQFATPAEAATAYEAYLRASFAKPYVLGYFKCQYVDQGLPTGMPKEGLLETRQGPVRTEFAERLAAIHHRLRVQLKSEKRIEP